MKQRKFAAFDIDGTIARSALFFQIVDQLIADGHLPQSSRAEIDDKYESYRQRVHKAAFREYNQKSVDVLFGNMSNVKLSDYQKSVDTVINQTKKYVYVYTRDLIKSLRQKGYFLIALSGSEMYSVQEFAKNFDFDVAIGEVYHTKNGYLSGEIDQVVHRKDHYLNMLIAEHNLTLKDSFAVGDSMGDAEMLEIVENPIAFNPEDRLFEYAKSKGWTIVVERKNVIYELEQESGRYLLV